MPDDSDLSRDHAPLIADIQLKSNQPGHLSFSTRAHFIGERMDLLEPMWHLIRGPAQGILIALYFKIDLAHFTPRRNPWVEASREDLADWSGWGVSAVWANIDPLVNHSLVRVIGSENGKPLGGRHCKNRWELLLPDHLQTRRLADPLEAEIAEKGPAGARFHCQDQDLEADESARRARALEAETRRLADQTRRGARAFDSVLKDINSVVVVSLEVQKNNNNNAAEPPESARPARALIEAKLKAARYENGQQWSDDGTCEFLARTTNCPPEMVEQLIASTAANGEIVNKGAWVRKGLLQNWTLTPSKAEAKRQREELKLRAGQEKLRLIEASIEARRQEDIAIDQEIDGLNPVDLAAIQKEIIAMPHRAPSAAVGRKIHISFLEGFIRDGEDVRKNETWRDELRSHLRGRRKAVLA